MKSRISPIMASRQKAILFLWMIGLLSAPQPMRGQGLTDLRKEIDSLEKALKTREAQERSLLEIVEDLSREIGLRQKLLRQLESEKANKERQIGRSKKDLSKAESDFDQRKKKVSKRLVSMYQRGKMSDLEILLSVNNFNQVLVWLRYQQRILEHHQRNLRQLLQKRQEIQKITQRLEQESAERTRLMAESQSQKEKMEARKQAQQEPLSRIRKDRESILRQIEEKKRAYAQIQKRIAEEESRKKTPQEIQRLEGVGFAKLKGRLPWPVAGRIEESYGMQKHPVSKTVYENQGIDIKTDSNAMVHVVAEGRVIHIDWVPGRGNVALVDHGGFYTVYGQLAMVDIAAGDYLKQGDVLGQVGDAQSLYGSSLHFEVWKGKEHLNPASWLGK